MNKYKALLVSSFSVLLVSFMLSMKSNLITSQPSLLAVKIVIILSSIATIAFFILDIIYSRKAEY